MHSIGCITRPYLCRQQTAPGDVVSTMGFLQAQDYNGAKWSIGLRASGATDASIEQAIADKSIVRSWSFRGTLHFMPSAHIRSMVAVAAPRVLPNMATNLRRFALDQATLSRCMKILIKTLEGGNHLTRPELMAAIQQKNISTEDLRSNFIMLYAALHGIICCGVRRGKEFTYTLLDGWLPPAPPATRTETLTTLALCYFTSHAPASLHDFAWWLGITLTDARDTLHAIDSRLHKETIGGQTYYSATTHTALPKPTDNIFLLPGFDEYLLGYKDRSLVLSPAHAPLVVGSGNGLFSPTIIINGQVAGTWKRTIKKNAVAFDFNPFHTLTKKQTAALNAAAARYSLFLGKSGD